LKFIDRIFGRKSREQKTLENEIAELSVFAESLRRSAVECVPQTDKISTRVDESRLGGWPAWPKGQDLPKAEDGESMIFLAQLNFADTPAMAPFPSRGLLQFFCADEDLFGSKFPSEQQSGFRTIYHESTEDLILVDPYQGQIPEMMPFQDENLCENGYPLLFKEASALPGSANYEIYAKTEHLWSKKDPNLDALIDSFFENLDNDAAGQMFFGGHPKFVQYDIRSADKYSEYTHVLMQFGMPEGMMWGDAGEACFLISETDLKNKNFTNAIYSWDCG